MYDSPVSLRVNITYWVDQIILYRFIIQVHMQQCVDIFQFLPFNLSN
jgi:hypothetical protein